MIADPRACRSLCGATVVMCRNPDLSWVRGKRARAVAHDLTLVGRVYVLVQALDLLVIYYNS